MLENPNISKPYEDIRDYYKSHNSPVADAFQYLIEKKFEKNNNNSNPSKE